MCNCIQKYIWRSDGVNKCLGGAIPGMSYLMSNEPLNSTFKLNARLSNNI